jgi:hypothetical protein
LVMSEIKEQSYEGGSMISKNESLDWLYLSFTILISINPFNTISDSTNSKLL